MKFFPEVQVANLVKLQEAFFIDTAYYFAPEDLTNLDEYGQPTSTEAYEEIPCSFSDSIQNRSAIERWTDIGDISEVTAEIRFTGHIVPQQGGRVTLVRKFGVEQKAPIVYEVIGVKERGPFGFVCALKKATI